MLLQTSMNQKFLLNLQIMTLGLILMNAVPAHSAGPLCEAVFRSEKSLSASEKLKSGTAMTLVQNSFGSEIKTQTTFVGKIGDSFFGARSEGSLVTRLDPDFKASIGKSTQVIRLPEIDKQTSPDNCVETSLNYMLKVKKLEAETSSLGIAPSQLDPFGLRNLFPYLSTGIFQKQKTGALNFLKSQGFSPHEINSEKEFLAAVDAKQIIFIGASSSHQSFYLETQKGSLIANVDTMIPDPGGTAGHAMVIAGSYKDAEGTRYFLLADPYSGTVRPIPLYEGFFEAIKMAISI